MEKNGKIEMDNTLPSLHRLGQDSQRSHEDLHSLKYTQQSKPTRVVHIGCDIASKCKNELSPSFQCPGPS